MNYTPFGLRYFLLAYARLQSHKFSMSVVVFCRFRGVNVVILNKVEPKNWSLVGNKRWLLLGGSKCTIFVVVAIGGA